MLFAGGSQLHMGTEPLVTCEDSVCLFQPVEERRAASWVSQLSGTSVFSQPLVLALSATHAFYPAQARFDGACAEKELTLRWLNLGHKVFNKPY